MVWDSARKAISKRFRTFSIIMHLPRLLTLWTYKTVKKHHTNSLLPNVVRPQGSSTVILFILLVSHPPRSSNSPITAVFQHMISSLLQYVCQISWMNTQKIVLTVDDLKLMLIMTDKIPKNNLKDLSNGTDLETWSFYRDRMEAPTLSNFYR